MFFWTIDFIVIGIIQTYLIRLSVLLCAPSWCERTILLIMMMRIIVYISYAEVWYNHSNAILNEIDCISNHVRWKNESFCRWHGNGKCKWNVTFSFRCMYRTIDETDERKWNSIDFTHACNGFDGIWKFACYDEALFTLQRSKLKFRLLKFAIGFAKHLKFIKNGWLKYQNCIKRNYLIALLYWNWIRKTNFAEPERTTK